MIYAIEAKSTLLAQPISNTTLYKSNSSVFPLMCFDKTYWFMAEWMALRSVFIRRYTCWNENGLSMTKDVKRSWDINFK